MKRIRVERLVGALAASFSPIATPRLLHDVAAEEIIRGGWAADLDEALELAEPLLPQITALLFERQSVAELDGVAWTIEIFGSDDEYIRGFSTQDPSLSDPERRARAFRAHVEPIRQELLKLDPSDFEVACTAILRLMGCRDPHTSPRGNDGGIDFYGRLELHGRLDNASPYGGIDRRVGLWLVGQAKHYPDNPIQTAHLRELVGSVELARTGGAIHQWEGLQLRPFDAVIQLIFTTGTFAKGANKLLERSGMISMNGAQLSTFLADAGVGVHPTELTFSSAQFLLDLGFEHPGEADAC